MIKMSYKFIVNILFKIMLRGIIIEEKKWISHLSAVLITKRIIIKINTEMIPFHILYKYDAILFIKLDVLIWQTLAWNMI